jgi:threonine dehydratase
MPATLEPVRPIALAEIEAARERIAGTIVRTPLVRLELGPGFPDIRLKLENLQPINAYKLRGAANAVAMLSDAERRLGVWTISAGNAGQGVAYAARKAGVPCTVVAIETAPASKLERMRALGAPARHRTVRGGLEGAGRSRLPRRGGDLRASLRRPQFHRRPRHHGPGDP